MTDTATQADPAAPASPATESVVEVHPSNVVKFALVLVIGMAVGTVLGLTLATMARDKVPDFEGKVRATVTPPADEEPDSELEDDGVTPVVEE